MLKIHNILPSLSLLILAGTLAACEGEPSSEALAEKLAPVAANDIGADPDLRESAMVLGEDVFSEHCAQCHGADGKGSAEHHASSLTDDQWLYAGNDLNTGGLTQFPSDIERIVRYGIRSDHPETFAYMVMPALGAGGENVLSKEEIDAVTAYTLFLVGEDYDRELVRQGEEIFQGKGSCYDCHAPDGAGTGLGSTNLTRAETYLYGSDRESIRASIADGRSAVSPAFVGALSEGEIKAVAFYVLAKSASGIPEGPFEPMVP